MIGEECYMRESKKWVVRLLGLFKLETTTPSGRINLAGVVILAVFCILYTGNDAIQYCVATLGDTIKSIALKENVHTPYSGVSVLEAVLPVFVGFIICLVYLGVDERKKNSLKEKETGEVTNPVEKL